MTRPNYVKQSKARRHAEPFENKTGEAKSQVQNIELIWDNAKATH
jgi:hypothetical protein